MKGLPAFSGFMGLVLIAGCSLMLDDFSTRYDGGERDADGADGTDAGDFGGDDGEAGCGDCGENAHCVGGQCQCVSDYIYCAWSPDWWDPDWPIRLKIVFDASQVTQNLENVPVLVELNGTRVEYERILDQGADLRFIDASGDELFYQVDRWQDRDTSYFWVKMPQIAAGSAAEILWMYYGNPDGGGITNPSAVWDGFYNAVYHLGSVSAVVEDSCPRQNHGQVYNAAYTPSGKFGGAYRFTPEASNRIEAGTNSASAVVGTFEGWVKYEGDAAYPEVNYMIFGLSRNYCGSRNWIQLGAADTGVPEGFRSRYEDYDNCGAGFARVTTGVVALPGIWRHVAYTWDTGAHEYRIYVDGIERGSNVVDTPATIEHDAVRIGAIYSDGHDGFEGTIDEARISGIVRSADWIWFQHCTAAQTCVSYFNQ